MKRCQKDKWLLNLQRNHNVWRRQGVVTPQKKQVALSLQSPGAKLMLLCSFLPFGCSLLNAGQTHSQKCLKFGKPLGIKLRN